MEMYGTHGPTVECSRHIVVEGSGHVLSDRKKDRSNHTKIGKEHSFLKFWV